MPGESETLKVRAEESDTVRAEAPRVINTKRVEGKVRTKTSSVTHRKLYTYFLKNNCCFIKRNEAQPNRWYYESTSLLLCSISCCFYSSRLQLAQSVLWLIASTRVYPAQIWWYSSFKCKLRLTYSERRSSLLLQLIGSHFCTALSVAWASPFGRRALFSLSVSIEPRLAEAILTVWEMWGTTSRLHDSHLVFNLSFKKINPNVVFRQRETGANRWALVLMTAARLIVVPAWLGSNVCYVWRMNHSPQWLTHITNNDPVFCFFFWQNKRHMWRTLQSRQFNQNLLSAEWKWNTSIKTMFRLELAPKF